jgi:Ca2+-binding EF-hand superfamily protein
MESETMRKKLVILAGIGTLCTVPAVALAAGAMGYGPMATVKRADVEAQVKERFAMLDANKDGAVTREEILGVHAKMRQEMMSRRFEMMDANKDGAISRAEFDAAHNPPAPVAGAATPAPVPGMAMGDGMKCRDMDGDGMKGEGMMRGHMGRGMGHGGMGHGMGMRMFEMADANKDGKVTLAEMTKVRLDHFDQVDTNHDGQITPEERHTFHSKAGANLPAPGQHGRHGGHY